MKCGNSEAKYFGFVAYANYLTS